MQKQHQCLSLIILSDYLLCFQPENFWKCWDKNSKNELNYSALNAEYVKTKEKHRTSRLKTLSLDSLTHGGVRGR